MKILLNRRLIGFSILFGLFSVIGTVSHEYGHMMAAQYLGHPTTLHYGSMEWDNTYFRNKAKPYREGCLFEIRNNIPFPDKERYEKITADYNRHRCWITLGGPAQTMLTGTLGFILLLYRRYNRDDRYFRKSDWLLVFLSLFWTRQIFNLGHSILAGLLGFSEGYFGGDEARLSDEFGLYPGSIPIGTALIGMLICAWVVFKVIPRDYRIIFIASGFIGGLSGFVGWMYFIGPVLLP